MDYANMDKLIESWRGEIFARLKTWIAIPSVNAPSAGAGMPFGREVREMLDLFVRDAREMGFTAEQFDGYAGHACLGSSGARTMGILAHLDVVPSGDGWTRDPFGGEIIDGKFYGRGVSDDKGPALAALYAMRAVREAGIPLKDGVRLIVGCDEETGMEDLRHYASVQKMPDYGFSPDADYPLINIEKGGLSILLTNLSGGEDGARIPVYALYAGERQNVVPGLATATVGTERVSLDEIARSLKEIEKAREGFRLDVQPLDGGRAKITATGVSAHASMPHLGVNAAGMLLIALKELGAGGGSRKAIAALADKLGMAGDGRGVGIAISDELSGPLTCNLGILRYDGQVLTAQLDIRYPIAADETTMCGQIAMACSEAGLSVRRLDGRVPLHVPAENEVVQGLLEVYHEVTGLPAYPIAIGGGTYSRMMPNTVAFGINFPGDDDPCHMPDECVDMDKFMLSVRIMAHAIARLAGE